MCYTWSVWGVEVVRVTRTKTGWCLFKDVVSTPPVLHLEIEVHLYMQLPAEWIKGIFIQEVVITLRPLNVDGEPAVWDKQDKWNNKTLPETLFVSCWSWLCGLGGAGLHWQPHIYLWIIAHTEGSRLLAANHRPPWLQSLQTKRRKTALDSIIIISCSARFKRENICT